MSNILILFQDMLFGNVYNYFEASVFTLRFWQLM
jgi:hypothetical protein